MKSIRHTNTLLDALFEPAANPQETLAFVKAN